MQDFSYHNHNHTQGIGDGRNTCEEMIAQAEKIGFREIGVSNHLVYHHNMPLTQPQFFNDFNRALDYAQKNIDEIRETATRHHIKVYAGFEVDFFPSAQWRDAFEKIIRQTKPDYLIGSTHNAFNEAETVFYNLWSIPTPAPSSMKPLLEKYWQNVIDCINSGYFDFIAHFDLAANLGVCQGDEWNEWKHKVVAALIAKNQPFEINTKGIYRCGTPSPDWGLIKQLVTAGVPTLISDDAHSTDLLGSYYDVVESKLAEFGSVNRFHF